MRNLKIKSLVIFMIMAVVTARLDKVCYRECCMSCMGIIILPSCFEACLKGCQVPSSTLSNVALHHSCIPNCAKSKCANFTSDDSDKATSCLDSCIEECKKNN
ncbi:hypothetical protein ACOSP7_030702 [Xanthoceras sorbifolium]